VPIQDINNPEAVRQAIREFRLIGQARFLKKYGFGASRGWMLRDDDGQEFDAKAILGAAHGYQFPALGHLPQSEFYGGEVTARKLRDMGFTVTEPDTRRNPTWSRDELILGLDLYMRHRPSFPDDKHAEVIALSQLLNELATTATGNASFRNPNGVAMKLMNFRRLDPDQQGRGLAGGGKQEEDVWRVFAADLPRLRSTAAAIAATVQAADTNDDDPSINADEGEEAEEGQVLTRQHRVRERNRAIIERRKAKALREHGRLHCEACDFDFTVRYGERGSGFIECHHTRPVSTLKPGEKTKLEELALLCANCHRMIHIRRPWLSVDDLRRMIQSA
jgi:5-methylcytosine-specific restriction protein A